MPIVLTTSQIEDFREALCRGAVKLYAKRGYAGVTMRALAERAGCSRSTPYHYFKSKDAILAAARAKAFGRLANALGERFDPHPNSLARVRALCDAYLGFARSEPDAYRLMFDLRQPGRWPELRRERRRAHARLLAGLRIAVESGDMAGEAETLANSLWASMHGLASLDLSGQWRPGPKLEELYETHLGLVLGGMTFPRRRPRVKRRVEATP